MSENEVNKDKKSTTEVTKEKPKANVYIREKGNGTPTFVMILCTAVIAGAVGCAGTYLALTKGKVPTNTVTNNGNSQSIKIEATDTPVIAIAKKAGPSIVGVKINALTQTMFGSLQEANEEGSGIIYSADGYIVTNYHVIESAVKDNSATITVTFANSEDSVEASIVGYDEPTDLAVIKIEKDGLVAAEFGKSSELQVGDLAVAIGNPLGQEFAGSVTVGYISALNRKLTTSGRTYKLVQTDAAINPGNSGGALVNSQGQVIGINTVKVGASLTGTSVEGLGFAIPSDDAVEIIDKLIKDKKIVRPYIGISGINVDQATAKRNDISEGIYVAQVLQNSPASKAGIEKGDIITGIEGKDIKTMEELNEIKNTKNVGDKITLKVKRKNEEKEIKVTLGSDDSTKASN